MRSLISHSAQGSDNIRFSFVFNLRKSKYYRDPLWNETATQELKRDSSQHAEDIEANFHVLLFIKFTTRLHFN